jgi:hypothetical protein
VFSEFSLVLLAFAFKLVELVAVACGLLFAIVVSCSLISSSTPLRLLLLFVRLRVDGFLIVCFLFVLDIGLVFVDVLDDVDFCLFKSGLMAMFRFEDDEDEDVDDIESFSEFLFGCLGFGRRDCK